MAQYTPMIEQYLKIKAENPEALLFFRLGDFYEMFFDDAILAARELEIVLTARDGGYNQKIPMCGVPYHAVNNYISKLIRKGYKIAICEQVEDPKKAVGIVKRAVTRIITPGTVLDNAMLDEAQNNYLVAVVEEKNVFGLAFADISTGEFQVTEFASAGAKDELLNEVQRLQPAELLLVKDSFFANSFDERMAQKIVIEAIDLSCMQYDNAVNILSEQFGSYWLDSSGVNDFQTGIKAAAAIILFIKQTQKTNLKQMCKLKIYNPQGYMGLDAFSRRNLELLSGLRDGKKEGSLLGILDKCSTPMGKRTLRSFIEQPLTNLDLIEKRLDAVEELVQNQFLQESFTELLKAFYDIERLAARLGSGIATPRDLIAIKKSLLILPELVALCKQSENSLFREFAQMDTMDNALELLEAALLDDAPLSIREGGIIKEGYNQAIDELKSLASQGKDYLMAFEQAEKERTGIKYLKIGFNKVFGYFIEITKANLSMVPDNYIRKQTLVNAERYITEELKQYEEKILGAREKLVDLEYECFNELREQLEIYIQPLLETANIVANIDVLNNFAKIAYHYDYVRPEINLDDKIEIKGGRHPVIEHFLNETSFVPNDVKLDLDSQRMAIITGPNMGGKSTYMRQIALQVLMAQMGSFVPAKSAKIGLVDKIFTRVGAADDLSAGQSTFMVEMLELAYIINNATHKSLIILDEIGRGTSTFDGLSIARAASEFIHQKIKARTLFATHYHELTELANEFYGIFNLSVSVLESGDKVTFLKKVLPGKADKSYGIHVAALAGLPQEILNRANEILKSLEESGNNNHPVNIVQNSLFPEEQDELKQKILGLELNDMTPRKALQILYQLQEDLK